GPWRAVAGPTKGQQQRRCLGERSLRACARAAVFSCRVGMQQAGFQSPSTLKGRPVKMTDPIKGMPRRRGLTRRTFLKSSAGTAALLSAVGSQFPFGVHIAEAAGPEVKKAILGYIALMDASPLVIAKEKGI